MGVCIILARISLGFHNNTLEPGKPISLNEAGRKRGGGQGVSIIGLKKM